jgi:hypothetical protein
MGFLENYIGSSHANLLAALPERHAVAFGRACSCNDPLVLKLNEADDFRNGFWERAKAGIPTTESPRSDAPVEAPDDAIPF